MQVFVYGTPAARFMPSFHPLISYRWSSVGGSAMRCMSCGEEMCLVQVVEDKTKMVKGYEHHTFECSGCREIERRLVFADGRKGPVRRNARIVHHPKHEGSYAAQDAKSGKIIMLHQDPDRLRELCEWIGWRVVDGAASTSPTASLVPEVSNDQASDVDFVEHIPEQA